MGYACSAPLCGAGPFERMGLPQPQSHTMRSFLALLLLALALPFAGAEDEAVGTMPLATGLDNGTVSKTGRPFTSVDPGDPVVIVTDGGTVDVPGDAHVTVRNVSLSVSATVILPSGDQVSVPPGSEITFDT